MSIFATTITPNTFAVGAFAKACASKQKLTLRDANGFSKVLNKLENAPYMFRSDDRYFGHSSATSNSREVRGKIESFEKIKAEIGDSRTPAATSLKAKIQKRIDRMERRKLPEAHVSNPAQANAPTSRNKNPGAL